MPDYSWEHVLRSVQDAGQLIWDTYRPSRVEDGVSEHGGDDDSDVA
jgi:hypothetical protein